MGQFLKKHKKKIILLVVLIAVAIFVVFKIKAKKEQLPVVETTTVQYGDLVNAVSVNGTVASENSKKVYSKLTYPILINNVEVGDRVNAGDILCELDVGSIRDKITEQKAVVDSTAAINDNTISLAEKQYEIAIADLEDDVNGTIAQAEQAVTAAKQRLESAELSLDGSIDSLQKSREDDRFSGVDGKSSLTVQAANSRDQAYASYEAAKENLADAERNLEVAKHGVERQIESLNDQIETTRVASSQVNSQRVGIRNLENDLSDAIVTSPINGVVTAVYVNEGATPAGLMYVVEDIDDLKVEANIKEYDLTSVTVGNMVEIKSDATGEEVYTGKVQKIAPTTKKAQTGDNAESSGGGEFKTEIGVDNKKSDLRIGTKARLEIVYEKKENVNSVAYESLTTDKDGNQVVLVPELEAEGVYKLRAVKVETGMETDFMVEIISSELKPGDMILTNAQDFEEGMFVNLAPILGANGMPIAAEDPAAAEAVSNEEESVSKEEPQQAESNQSKE